MVGFDRMQILLFAQNDSIHVVDKQSGARKLLTPDF
jgi:hypothetical protein